MRPGPGLVVMALAFISGARRGSTSISSKTLTSSPTSSSSSSSSILSSSPSSSSSITTTTTEKSAFKDLQTSVEIYSQTLTPESLDLGKEKKQDWQHIEKASTTTVSTPVLTNGLYLSGALNYYPAPELVLPVQLKLSLYLDSRSRSTRNLAFTPVSHTRRAYKNTKSKRKARSAIGGYNVKRVNNEFSIKGDRSRLIIDSEDISTSDVTSNSGSIDLKQEKANGLTVYFPVHSADTSRSFDADDIFALVAEDDLLSEESFDHLLKLTDDKIGYLHNGEDYSGTGSVVVEGTQNSGGRGGSENKFSHKDSDDDEYIFERKISEQQKGAKIKELINNEPVHAALLVAQQSNNQNSNREVEPLLNLSKFSSTHNEAKNFGPTTSDTISKPPSKHRSIIESKHPLARLNPWISACDLAQPGPITAPDLQGECSAGTLPVAWVDEGPGPPTCPNSCKNLPLNNKHNTGINNNNNNNNENNISNNDNNNNNYNNKNLNNNKKNYNNINNNLNFHNDNKLETKPVSYANNFSIKLRNSQMSKTRETEIGAAATPVNNRHYNARKISQNFKFNPNHNNYNKNFSNNYNLNVENNSIHHRREKKDSINQVLLQKTKDKFIATATAIKEKNITVTATTTATAMTTLASHVNASSAFDATTAAAATTANTTTTTSTATNITTTIIVTTSSSSIAIKNITTNQEHSKLNAADFKQQDNVKSAVTSPIAIAVDTMPLRKYSNNNNNFKDTLKVDIKPTRYDSNDGNELIYNRLNPDYDHNNNNNERSPRNFNILSRETRDQPFKWMPDSNQLIIEDYDTNDKKQEMKEDVNEKERKRKQQKQQQQCLEYLGDSDKTTPKHLCNLNSPGELLSQLRQLRLKNCCERNVYSALHTLALNVTLSGGDECERILNHIMELDALAARITCGLSNILYRFDCRQIYSIIHQCDDCKEAYRRWVCSTLVPYFAEPSDVIIIDDNSNNYNNKNINNNAHQRNKDKNNNYNESEISKVAATNAITHHTVSMTRNVSAANTTHNSLYSLSPPLSLTSSLLPTSAFVKGSRDEMTTTNLRRTAGNATALLTANLIVPRNENHHQKRQEEQQLNNNNDNSNYHKIDVNFINNIYINSNSNNKNNIINFINHERSKPNLNKPQKSSIKSEQIQQSPAITYSDVIHYDTKQNDINVDMNYPTLVTTRRQKRNIINDTGQQQQQQQHQQEQEQLQSQSNNFISTANNMNPVRREGSVISQNFMKRIKRKIEFRKRRRIRPCLSVCQTVEQKCPYLLPADRAPALPTQYAGEPTFLCLDQNIPETGEQLEKSSHGPADCCYTYCGEAQNGLCTYCNEYAEIRELYPSTISENKRKIHNITLQPTHIKNEKTPIRLETRIRAKLGLNQTDDNILMASVAIAITNETLWRTNETQLIERLPYYAYCDGVFYYDDDINDMPEKATSGNCYPLPTMQSRCTTPYYADDYPSAAKRSRELSRSQCWLLWLSIILCLSSTYRSVNYQTIQRRIFHHEGYKYIDDGVIQLHKRQSIIAYDYNKRLPNKRLMKWMFEVMMMRRKVGITVYNNGVEGSTLKILSQFARRSKLKLNIYKRNDSHGNNKINLATPYTYKNNLLLFVKENLIIIIIKIVNATTVAVVVIIFTNALTKTGTLRMLKRNNSNSSNINNNNNNNNNNAKFHTFHVKGNNQEEKFNTNSSRQRRRQDKDKGSQSQSQTHCSYSCSSNGNNRRCISCRRSNKLIVIIIIIIIIMIVNIIIIIIGKIKFILSKCNFNKHTNSNNNNSNHIKKNFKLKSKHKSININNDNNKCDNSTYRKTQRNNTKIKFQYKNNNCCSCKDNNNNNNKNYNKNTNNCNINKKHNFLCRYFYYYNFNINDWWHRWYWLPLQNALRRNESLQCTTTTTTTTTMTTSPMSYEQTLQSRNRNNNNNKNNYKNKNNNNKSTS